MSAANFSLQRDSLCFLCAKLKRAIWVKAAGLDAVACPWSLRDYDEYKETAAACEIPVAVSTEADLNLIRTRVAFDKRPPGAKGRALVLEIPHVRLLKVDSLEPDESMPDVALVDGLRAPCSLLFSRRNNTPAIHHRNILLSEKTSLTPEQRLALDWLHCLSLGVFQSYFC